MNNFYRENILDHYKNPRNFGRLANPDASFSQENTLCGDKIGMDIKLKIKNLSRAKSRDEKLKIIENIRFQGEGCAISMAAASMLMDKVEGKDIGEVKKMDRDDILKILGIELTPTRLKCALLPLEVLQKAINSI